MRADLLARATVAILTGLRARSCTAHGRRPASSRTVRITAVAPTTSSRRRWLPPCLLMPPSRSLPPELYGRGVRPSQAANCRPDRNIVASGTAAAIAEGSDGSDGQDGRQSAAG